MASFRNILFGEKGLLKRQTPTVEGDEAAIARLNKLSIVLDSAFRIPIIGTRIGADALLNFVPGAGLLIAKGLSGYIIWEAHRLGVPNNILARMMGNLGIDFAISIVPVAGWVGDAFYRANLRNVALLKAHLHERANAPYIRRTSRRAAPIIDGDWVRSPA